MATDHILALLLSERGKLNRAIEALTEETPGPIRKAVPPKAAVPVVSVKRKLSAAGRRAIIAATKKRWAAVKAAKAAAGPTPVAAGPKVAPAKAPPRAKHKAATAKNAAFRKKMSERMKAAWAARKKKAAGKK